MVLTDTSSNNYLFNNNDISTLTSVCNKYNLNLTKNNNTITMHSIEKGCDFIIESTSNNLSVSVPIKNSDYNYNVKFYNKYKGVFYFINMINYYMDESFEFTDTTHQLQLPLPQD